MNVFLRGTCYKGISTVAGYCRLIIIGMDSFLHFLSPLCLFCELLIPAPCRHPFPVNAALFSVKACFRLRRQASPDYPCKSLQLSFLKEGIPFPKKSDVIVSQGFGNCKPQIRFFRIALSPAKAAEGSLALRSPAYHCPLRFLLPRAAARISAAKLIRKAVI